MRIHIIGIAGTMTAPLAVNLKTKGNYITGSDQDKIYPPISTLLKKADIPINNSEITSKIDLVIVGSSYLSFKKTKDEFNQVKKLKIPYLSATQYIAKNIAKENSILIAGSYGKSTITSLLTWIYKTSKEKPNYMFGAYPKNRMDSLDITFSDDSIIEADESINGLDTQAKFLYYPVKHLILTSADWEHQESYSNELKNFNAFKELILNVPKEGTLLINSQGHNTKKLSLYSQAPIITYNSLDSDYFIEKIKRNKNLTHLIINTPRGLIPLQSRLIGDFNFQNILAAVAMADHLNIPFRTIQKAVFTYRGIKRRIELIAKEKNILFFDDFAQSKNRIESTINSLKNHFPNKKVKVFFQPHASFLQFKKSLDGLKLAFKEADQIILGPLKFTSKVDKDKRNTAKDFKKELSDKLTYIPIEKDIIDYYIHHLSSNDILVYMSSGGSSGNRVVKSIIKHFS